MNVKAMFWKSYSKYMLTCSPERTVIYTLRISFSNNVYIKYTDFERKSEHHKKNLHKINLCKSNANTNI